MLGYIFHVEKRVPLARDTCVIPVGRVDLTKTLMWRRARKLIGGQNPKFFSQIHIPEDFPVAVVVAHFPDYAVKTERSAYAPISAHDDSVQALLSAWLAASLQDMESRDLLYFMLGERCPEKCVNYTKDLRLVTGANGRRRD